MVVIEVQARGRCGGYCVGTLCSMVIDSAAAFIPNSVPCSVMTVAVVLEQPSVEFKSDRGHPVMEVMVRGGLL